MNSKFNPKYIQSFRYINNMSEEYIYNIIKHFACKSNKEYITVHMLERILNRIYETNRELYRKFEIDYKKSTKVIAGFYTALISEINIKLKPVSQWES